MTEPPEQLADPTLERLAGHTPRRRHERPPAEFSRSTRILIYTAAALGVAAAASTSRSTP